MEAAQVSVLVRRAAEGDQLAWNVIVTEYSRLVWSVVRRFRLGDEQAADAVQVTWLRLIEHIGSVREPERLPGWLRTTARRVCIEVIRDYTRERPVDPQHDSLEPQFSWRREPVTDGPEASALRREHLALVRAAADALPARDRALLALLVASPPPSYREIGARLGMPVGSIGPTRARILHKLHDALKEAGLRDLALG